MDLPLLMNGFRLIKFCSDYSVLRQALNLFEFKRFGNDLIDEIKDLLGMSNYKQAGIFIAELSLMKQIPFEDIVIPLVILNEFSVIENLNDTTTYQNDTMKFLDTFIDRRASAKNICRPLIL